MTRQTRYQAFEYDTYGRVSGQRDYINDFQYIQTSNEYFGVNLIVKTTNIVLLCRWCVDRGYYRVYDYNVMGQMPSAVDGGEYHSNHA